MQQKALYLKMPLKCLMRKFSYWIPRTCEEVGIGWKSGTFYSSFWLERASYGQFTLSACIKIISILLNLSVTWGLKGTGRLEVTGRYFLASLKSRKQSKLLSNKKAKYETLCIV